MTSERLKKVEKKLKLKSTLTDGQHCYRGDPNTGHNGFVDVDGVDLSSDLQG